MPLRSKPISPDIHGIASLTTDGLIVLTEIVEAMHHTISSLTWPLGAAQQQRASGVAGLVYWGIRTAGELARSGVDRWHERTEIADEHLTSSVKREAALAILNGVLGDHMAARNNPLTIPMQWRRDGKPWETAALKAAIEQADGKVAIMLHGSCMNDLQWHHKGHSHGATLAEDLGVLPLYLHYNSGLHISENGRALAALIATLNENAPCPLDMVIVAHSMGGLVARSACHYAKSAENSWLHNLHKIVFLGTPHHGAPLERGGNWIDTLLELSPYSAPLARLGKLRSSGVTDLRYGNVVDADWQGRDRFTLAGDQRTLVPLPQDVDCYAVAATKSSKMTMLGDELIGDNLVPLSSALGRHRDPARTLDFAVDNLWIGRELNHKDLLSDQTIYAVINNWLSA